jgi:hypothetical protein
MHQNRFLMCFKRYFRVFFEEYFIKKVFGKAKSLAQNKI